jgi:hypothetical protein
LRNDSTLYIVLINDNIKRGRKSMPSSSKAQERFMRAVAHSPEFAAKVHVSQKVGEEFMKADQAKKNPPQSKSEKRYGKKKKS